MTARVLAALGELGGPRCCKRNSFVAIREAAAFTRECLGISMDLGEMVCTHSHQNNQCHKAECPFHPKKAEP